MFCSLDLFYHLSSSFQVAVYDKTLRLSSYTLTSGKMTTGQITNFMSVDAQNIEMMYEYVHYAYSVPIQVCCCYGDNCSLYWTFTDFIVFGSVIVQNALRW